MANIFQKIAQKAKDVAGGVYHQFATNDGGQNYQSYLDEQERKRREQQQQAAQRAQQQMAQRNQNSGGLQVASPSPTPKITIAKPQATPDLKVAVPGATPTISVPKPTVPQVPKPTQQFKGFTMDQGKNKTIFGKNAAWLLPKSLEKTYGVKVNRDVTTDHDSFMQQYDKLGDDFKKVYTNQVVEQAGKGDKVAQATLKALQDTGRMKGGFSEFAEGANDKLYGGLTRGALRTTDFVLPGKNTFGLEAEADKLDPTKQGTQQFTQRGKQGEKFGTVEKGIVDLATIAVGGGAADKGVEAVQRAAQAKSLLERARLLGLSVEEANTLINGGAKVAQNVPKYQKFLQYAAKIAPGSFVGSGIDALQTKGRGDDVNIGKSAGIGLATDLATPVILKPVEKLARKGIGLIGDKITGKAAAQGLDDAADEGVNDLVDHSLTWQNIRDKVKLPVNEEGGIRLAEPPTRTPAPAVDELSDAEKEAAQRASDALSAGDDTALKQATDDLDRLRTQYIETPIESPTAPRTTPDVEQPTPPPVRSVEPTDTRPPVIASAAEDAAQQTPELKVPEQSVPETPAAPQIDEAVPNAPDEVALPQSLTDRIDTLHERALSEPTPENAEALLEARREAAARQAAVQNNSVTATSNQDLVVQGLVDPNVNYKPVGELKIGSDSMDEVDPSAVAQYKEQIQNGQPIDPIIVKTDENGVSYIQDGKHRAQALQELGVENAPISEQVTRAERTATEAPTPQERGFNASVRSNPDTLPEVKEAITKTDASNYDPITNEETLRRADEAIDADPEAAIERAKNQQEYGTDVQAQSMRLIDRLQAAGRVADAVEIVEATARRATEAGQATQILAAYNRLTPEGILGAAQREITNAQKLNPEKYANLKISEEQATKLRTMAEDLQKLPEGSNERKLATRALLTEISRVVPTPGARKLVTLWKAGLLTGVKGAVGGNTVGNTAAAIMRKVADVPASMIDTVLAQATGHRSKVFTLKGLLGGFGEGLKVGVKNFKEGVGAESQAIKLDYKAVNFGQGKLGRAAQKYTDSVFNFYSASDRPFYHAALANNLRDLAKVEAKNAGLSGKAARDFVQQTIKEPPDDILTQAVAAAEEATFQGKNALGAALSGAKRGLASKGAAGEVAGEVLMPFTGVPSAIAKQVLDYSPAGAVTSTYKAIRQAANGNFDQAAQRRLSEALGRGITGTGVIWMGMQLHKDGILTLGYPTDPKERALWESEGKTPFSIKIGGKWRSMNYTGSIMSLMAIGGQINEASKDGGNPVDNIAAGIAGSGKAILGSTPLQGLQGGLDAVTDPERYGTKFVQNTAGSVVPTLVKDIAVANDPLQRQVNSPIDAIQSRIPGARNGLPAKLDKFGNDLERANSAIGSVIDPFKSSTARDSDPLSMELRRLQDAGQGLSPPTIDKKTKFDGVEVQLSPEQVTALTKQTNNKVQAAWSALMADPAYQGLSDEDKKKALANASGDIAASERYRYASENGLGQFAAGFSGKPTVLSGKQDALLTGSGFDVSNYTSPGSSTRINKDVSSTSKATLTKIEGMPSDKKKVYLDDPKNNYAYQLAQFENDFKNGDLSEVDQYNKVQELGSLKVKSGYSKEANELYGLSKKKLADFLEKKGGVSQKVLDEVNAMDQQLAAEGYISKPKFGGAVGSSGGSGGGGGSGGKEKKIAIPKPVFGSFGLVEAPKSPSPTMNSVMSDLQKAFADIKVLQGVQVAPGSDSSKIQLSTI
ncbi:ParB N-terminal domain-containing protein [Candidatus Poribacteria bacterium]|nr:ParB N-terminal domain-containing protein [Candidatus Poribacteria bacterium]